MSAALLPVPPKGKHPEALKPYAFKPGHKGGPGRPPRDVELTYFEAMHAGCDLKVFQEIVKAVAARALKGNLCAAKLLFDRLLPAKRLEDLGLNAGQINVLVLNDGELLERREALREVIAK